MSKDNNEMKKYWIKYIAVCFTVIVSIILVFSGIFLVFPVTTTSDISCSTGDIDLDFQVNVVNEKVTEEIPCYFNPSNTSGCTPMKVTRWNQEPLIQYFRLMGIDNLNCKIKTTSTGNMLYEVFKSEKTDSRINEFVKEYYS